MPKPDSLSLATAGERSYREPYEEIRVTGVRYGFCRLTAPWGTAIPTLPTARLHVVTHGECFIRIVGGDWIALEAGDLALLPLGGAHALADRPDRPLRQLADYRVVEVADRVYELAMDDGDGSTTRLSCSEFDFAPEQAALLPLMMPPLIIVSRSTDQDPLLKILIREIALEVGDADFGRSTMLRRLADLLLARILRLTWTQRGDGLGIPVLRTDRELTETLQRILRRPYLDWSVDALASDIGLSRSRLTDRCRRAFGIGPATLLRHVRLSRAASAIRLCSTKLQEVAEEFGYSDASALSRAYKSMFGVSPRGSAKVSFESRRD